MSETDPIYVASRRALLDALIALNAHSDAVVVAGAQAVYLRSGPTDIAIAPFTTDGDLALDPALLRPDPELEVVMDGAGFRLDDSRGHIEPGIWETSVRVEGRDFTVPIDLIVPTGVAPPGGSRGARLEAHGKKAARKARGLEAALVDCSPMTIASLEPSDARSVDAQVAGVAALMVAKAHKLHDRVAGDLDRQNDKDAADIFRLMQTSDPAEVGRTLEELCRHDDAGGVSRDARAYLEELFGRRGYPGINMAVRALQTAIPEDRVVTICTAYTARLTAASRSSR